MSCDPAELLKPMTAAEKRKVLRQVSETIKELEAQEKAKKGQVKEDG